MTVKTILTEPNPLLRQVSKAVEKVGKDEQKLIKSLIFGRCIAHRENDTWSCSEKMQDPDRLSQHH